MKTFALILGGLALGWVISLHEIAYGATDDDKETRDWALEKIGALYDIIGGLITIFVVAGLIHVLSGGLLGGVAVVID